MFFVRKCSILLVQVAVSYHLVMASEGKNILRNQHSAWISSLLEEKRKRNIWTAISCVL